MRSTSYYGYILAHPLRARATQTYIFHFPYRFKRYTRMGLNITDSLAHIQKYKVKKVCHVLYCKTKHTVRQKLLNNTVKCKIVDRLNLKLMENFRNITHCQYFQKCQKCQQTIHAFAQLASRCRCAKCQFIYSFGIDICQKT